MRGELLIGTNNDEIRDEALERLWGLGELRQEGMKMENAARSSAQMSNEYHRSTKWGNIRTSKEIS